MAKKTTGKAKEKVVNLGGAPPLYDNPETLQQKIDQYFDNGVATRQVIIGKGENKQTLDVKVPTITGLCLFLGFESRQSFYDYEKRIEFSYTIKKARMRVEKEYEELLQWGNTTGAIFALKNLGWKDETFTDHTTGGEKIQPAKIEFYTTKPNADK